MIRGCDFAGNYEKKDIFGNTAEWKFAYWELFGGDQELG
jgi:hypothetical protein